MDIANKKECKMNEEILKLYQDIAKLNRQLKKLYKKPRTEVVRNKIKVWQMDLYQKTKKLEELKGEK